MYKIDNCEKYRVYFQFKWFSPELVTDYLVPIYGNAIMKFPYNEALRLNNRSYSVGVSKLRHLHVLILAPVILILTGIIQQKSWQCYNKLLVHNLSFLYLPKQI